MEDLEKLRRLFEDDIRSLVELTFTNGPVQDRHVRQASVIVRRWLCDNELNQLARLLEVAVTFPVQDDAHLFEAAKKDPDIDYYLSAGVKFNGRPIMQLYASRADHPPRWVELLAKVRHKDVRLGKAMNRPTLYFEGETFSLGEVLRFACNKLGGAHLDHRRDAREEKLERATKHLTFGPPVETLAPGQAGETHLPLEGPGADVLSGISVSVIVAATMLVNICFDGKPVFEIGDAPQPPTRQPFMDWLRRFKDR